MISQGDCAGGASHDAIQKRSKGVGLERMAFVCKRVQSEIHFILLVIVISPACTSKRGEYILLIDMRDPAPQMLSHVLDVVHCKMLQNSFERST